MNDEECSEDHLSMEYWKARALKAEDRAAESEEQIIAKDLTITTLKSKLTSSEDAKVRFSASADLASARVAEFQANSAEPIIKGLKPQFDVLQSILKAVKDVSRKIDLLEEMPAIVNSIKKIGDEMSQKMLEKEDELLAEAEAGPVCSTPDSDMEVVICLINRILKIFGHFGFSSETTAVDVPQTVRSILTSALNISIPPPPPVGTQVSGLRGNQEEGFSAGSHCVQQTNAPKISGTYLLDPRNNNEPRSSPIQVGPVFLPNTFLPGNGPTNPHNHFTSGSNIIPQQPPLYQYHRQEGLTGTHHQEGYPGNHRHEGHPGTHRQEGYSGTHRQEGHPGNHRQEGHLVNHRQEGYQGDHRQEGHLGNQGMSNRQYESQRFRPHNPDPTPLKRGRRF